MTTDKTIGIVLGLIVCAVVIAGNLRRGDAHLVSVYPDAVGVAIAPLVVYVVGRRRRLKGGSSASIQAFGIRVGAIAGVVFATGLGGFSLYWLGPWPLWAFGSSVALGSVFVLSCFAAYAAGHKRVTAVQLQ
jgi:hypothetical protein